MLDIKFIRDNPKKLDEALLSRGKEPVSEKVLDLDVRLRTCISELQSMQERRNAIAEIIKQSSIKKEKIDQSLLEEGSNIKITIGDKEKEVDLIKNQLNDVMLDIPNIPNDDCPFGKDENDNLELRKVGDIRNFNFVPKEHYVIGEELGLLNSEKAVKISGSRFALLIGDLARLERAVAHFMLDTHVKEFGYNEIYVPQIVKEDSMYGTAQLPKFRFDQFQTTDNMWLIPTAEVALTNLVREEILRESELPLRLTAYTQCFRSEAGSAGKDLQGIFRLRQFSKVELVSITTPEMEQQEHERMTCAAENILKKLELPYRVVALCTGDMGFASKKTYDIEVWIPGQNRYREISSCSMCGTFQARRMGARYRNQENNIDFVCTLNGSGLAVGRTVLAIMENYQQSDGSIIVPKELVKYMNGIEKIEKKENTIFS